MTSQQRWPSSQMTVSSIPPVRHLTAPVTSVRDALSAAWRPIFDDPSSRFQTEESFGVGDRVVQLWNYSWDGGHVRGVDVFKVTHDRIAEKLSYVKG